MRKEKTFLVLCLLPIAITAIALFMLPETIATHFGFTLNPDSYGSKYVMLVPSCLVLAMNVVLFFAYRRDVKRWNRGEAATRKKKAATIAVYYASVIFCDAILLVFTLVNLN
jgi:uncharacterized membrane protein